MRWPSVPAGAARGRGGRGRGRGGDGRDERDRSPDYGYSRGECVGVCSSSCAHQHPFQPLRILPIAVQDTARMLEQSHLQWETRM